MLHVAASVRHFGTVDTTSTWSGERLHRDPKAVSSNHTGLDYTIMSHNHAVLGRIIQNGLLDELVTGEAGASARYLRHAIKLYAGRPHPTLYNVNVGWQRHIDVGLLGDRLVAKQWPLTLTAAHKGKLPAEDFEAIGAYLQERCAGLPFNVCAWRADCERSARAVQVCHVLLLMPPWGWLGCFACTLGKAIKNEFIYYLLLFLNFTPR